MSVFLRDLEYHLPDGIRTNEDLVELNPNWNVDEIYRSTGIRARRVADDSETAGDLAFQATEKLFARLDYDRNKIDAVIFSTQMPDHFCPATACILQARLQLQPHCAAFDINLGCSGFTYGLWLSRALVESGAAKNVLLLNGDTLTRCCNVHDKITATIFGDGATAAIVTSTEDNALAMIGPSVVGTDGRGAPNLLVPAGGWRIPYSEETMNVKTDENGNQRSQQQMHMNGPEVFGFTLASVKDGIQQVLDRIQLGWDDIDRFLLHQANGFVLESLRRKMGIPKEKLPVVLQDVGNLANASLPMLLRRSIESGVVGDRHRCILAGFGIGYSWAMTYLEMLTSPND